MTITVYCFAVRSVLPSLNTVAVVQSSFHCTVPAVAPVVQIVHQENQHSTTSAKFASTSEDHHVYICPTTDTSLNITQPNDTSYLASNTTTGMDIATHTLIHIIIILIKRTYM